MWPRQVTLPLNCATTEAASEMKCSTEVSQEVTSSGALTPNLAAASSFPLTSALMASTAGSSPARELMRDSRELMREKKSQM